MDIFFQAQNIMYLAVALVIFMIGVLLSWLLFYFVMIVKDVREVLRKTKDTLEATSEVIAAVKEKLQDSSHYLKLLFEGIRTLVDFLNKKTDNGKKSGSDPEPRTDGEKEKG